MIIVTASQMQALDHRAITEAKIPSLTLMENAGAGVVTAMAGAFGALRGTSVVVVCGKGNNGGDGLVVARRMKQQRARVKVVLLAKTHDLTKDAKTMYGRFVRTAGASAVHVCPSGDRLAKLLQEADVVVDALLGTGLSSPVGGAYLTAIQAINENGRPVVAVDLPSGINADTGAVMGDAIQASLTVTFGLPKLGLYVGAGIDHAGAVEVVDIGIPPAYVESVDSKTSLMSHVQARQVLPRRQPASHKGTYGHAGIIAGSPGKTGAAALAARAALRTGAGLVTVATPTSVNETVETLLVEAMTVPMQETQARTLGLAALDDLIAFAHARQAVAIGPGLTTHQETIDLIRALVPKLQIPCVIDADGLNALGGHTQVLPHVKAPLVLTPHPGEMARLIDDVSSLSVNADRVGVASRFAKERNLILVLKGARTVVAHPDGRVAICPTGNPGMATGGTGDVLTGMIVSLLAQGCSAWDAACAGTYFHGLAGDLAAAHLGPAGMIAGDLVERIPYALGQPA